MPSPEGIRALCLVGLGERLLSHVRLHLQTLLEEEHVPRFWARLSELSVDGGVSDELTGTLTASVKVNARHSHL